MLSKALSHTLKELEIPNIVTSIEINFEEIRKSHDSIHEFIYLASLCLPSTTEVSWHQKSAFLTYHFEAFYQAHRSFLEALSGHYNAGYTLLRTVLELLLKGAFWECLAHKKFRENSGVLEREDNGKKLKNLLNDVVKDKPEIERQLEGMSATIHDMIMVVIENPAYRPSIRTIVKQLKAWDIFNPISNPVKVVSKTIYGELSADVHVIPDKTDIGRRLLSQKDLFETDVNPDELSKFIKVLHDVVDIGIVIELNVLSDWIDQDREVKTKLRGRLVVLEDLGLKFSSKKLKKLMGI